MGPHWIKQWINNLAVLNEQFRDDEGRVDFEALGREEYLFRMALITQNWSKSERARDTFERTKASYDKWVENGKQGGRPPKNSGKPEVLVNQTRAGADSVLRGGGSHSAPARTSGRKFRNKEEFMQWAIDKGLDASDASDCWEATEERGGKDGDGKAVKNMEAFAMQWCKTSAQNRRSA